MPDQTHPPPQGDQPKATKYISQVCQLILQDQLTVHHTDLSKFDPSNLEDHYRVDLKDHQIEISHSKQPNSGTDSYVMLFTNLQRIREGCDEKVILAYTHLDREQFLDFKHAADTQIDKRRKEQEQKKFEEVMQPVDKLLEDFGTNPASDGQQENESEKESPLFE